MNTLSKLNNDGCTLTVRIPMNFRKRGGRKQVIVPDDTAWAPARRRIDNTIVRALARAHRWKRMLEEGEFTTVTELARAKRHSHSYMCRVLRLTLLAPDIVERFLDGRQPKELQLRDLLKPLPVEWQDQRDLIKRFR